MRGSWAVHDETAAFRLKVAAGMGVRMIWTYLRTTIAKTIPLRAETPFQPLVIDLLGGCRRYLDIDYLWNFEPMRQRVREDVEALRRVGFHLIVFADSGYKPQPSSSWIQRRVQDLQIVYEINSTLQSREPERIGFAASRWRPPLSMTLYLTQAFRDAGCPVYITKENADHEGAGLSIKHDAYGVLSSDTDFLFYPGIRRFLNFTTFRLDENGMPCVDGVEKSLFLKYLGISEEKLPMIAGLLGSDLFAGLSQPDRQYLEYKWRLEWFPEAAAMEINTTPTNLIPVDSHLALEYYKPTEPDELLEREPSNFGPSWTTLKEKQVLYRGVAMDSLTEKPCHEVLAPLRRAVYARCGLQRVRECLCVPNLEPAKWSTGEVVEIQSDQPSAPEPPTDLLEAVGMACDFLVASGELDSLHRQILLTQIHHRSKLLKSISTFPSIPVMKDLHIASLFLQALEMLYLGSDTPQPMCWDIFHGSLYHYLCQNPKTLTALSPVQTQTAFDWGPVLEASIAESVESKIE